MIKKKKIVNVEIFLFIKDFFSNINNILKKMNII